MASRVYCYESWMLLPCSSEAATGFVLSRTNQFRTFTSYFRRNSSLLPYYLCVRFPRGLLPLVFPTKTFYSGRPIFLTSHSVPTCNVQPSIVLAKFYEDRTFRTFLYWHIFNFDECLTVHRRWHEESKTNSMLHTGLLDLMNRSTCFGHYCAHRQELATIQMVSA